MMIDLDVNVLANAKAKGKRPFFLDNPEVEKVLSITMAVAGELAVTRDRLDTIERLLDAKGVLSTAEIDAYVPDAAAEAERGAARQEYIARILRILQQEIERMEGADPDVEDVADMLGRGD